MDSTVICADGVRRCKWAASSDAFIKYHDEEWGVPQADDCVLYEKLCLEAFQSGLSWRTILEKRDNFRHAFDGFDFTKVKDYGAPDVARLMADSGVIRHKGKILATIHNAARMIDAIEEFGSFAALFGVSNPFWGRFRSPIYRRFGCLNSTGQSLEKKRVEVCWANDSLCLYAGNGPGK